MYGSMTRICRGNDAIIGSGCLVRGPAASAAPSDDIGAQEPLASPPIAHEKNTQS